MLNVILPVLILTAAMLYGSCPNLLASEIHLPRSGQVVSYAAGDDWAVQSGQALPTPRFTAANGAVTDNLTGLIWLQDADCIEVVGGIAKTSSSTITWADALTWSNNLASGQCGLTDGSSAGQWRLPTRLELESLVDLSQSSPALPAGHPFTAVQSGGYWTSSTSALETSSAWYVFMTNGSVGYTGKSSLIYSWPVRGGHL